MIFGNVDGIRNSILSELEKIYDMKIPKYNILTSELEDVICTITSVINREISVEIDRNGNVLNVAIGNAREVELPDIDMINGKLSRVRIIHSHPNTNSSFSSMDLSALIKLRLDCIASIGVKDGRAVDFSVGFCDFNNGKICSQTIDNISENKVLNIDLTDKLKYIEDIMKKEYFTPKDSQRAVLVSMDTEESITELKELARACDVECAEMVLQRKDKIDSSYYIGIGKLSEISMIIQNENANLIIFDDELSGSQVRNLEENLGVKVIDRTILVLEIFARRAKSKEAKLQVELAQLKYRLPRLRGLGEVLSRTGGGIGTKGPGEKKLEIDKRHINERVYDLKRELLKVKKSREVQREKRNSENIPRISLVGYTNAGKSTLRNVLCETAHIKDVTQKDNVFEAEMLFSTLDVTTRAILLNDNRIAVVSDTVGFVRKLPHDLIEAFKSTLEEVLLSDLLLHVVDASSSTAFEQIDAVNNVLKELGAEDKTTLLVLNKIDAASEEQIHAIIDKYASMDIIQISAREEINIDLLMDRVSKLIPNKLKKVHYIIPYSEQNIVSILHENSKILSEEYLETGTSIVTEVNDKEYKKYEKFMIEN
ncbi:MAG: GTPase HflX [Clostridium sp.]|nr:GTPase HflX [Clostridium sp.]